MSAFPAGKRLAFDSLIALSTTSSTYHLLVRLAGRGYGLIPDVRQVAWELVGQTFLAGLAFLALAGTFAMTAVSIARPASGLASASAFVLGAAAFSAYLQSKRPGALVSVHDADRFPGGTAQIDFGLIAWFLLYGCRHCWWSTSGAMRSPRRRSNCSSASRKSVQALGLEGLYVGFAGYPGEPGFEPF